MATVLQSKFWNQSPWIKIIIFWFKFRSSSFLTAQLTVIGIVSTNNSLLYWCLKCDIGIIPKYFDLFWLKGPSLDQSTLFTPQPSGLEGYCRHGPGGQAAGREATRLAEPMSVTAWRIFSILSSVELSRPVVVHYHSHLPIYPIRACPWAKNLSNLPQIESRLCGMHISATAGWIYPI